MPVLSIIACDMLEDEITYVLSKDSELEQLILIEKRECFGLQRKLKSLGCLSTLVPLDRIREILENRHKAKVTVVANMLKMGLHIDIELLKAEVYRNITEMSRFSDRILIFYGTCGHSLVNIEKDFESLECRLYFLKDDKGEIAEDCISVALGGNDAYARAMVNSEYEGTFFLTPMWASGWGEFSKEKFQELIEHDKKYIRRYRRVAKVNTGLSYEPDFYENVSEFARFFNLKIVELMGSKKIAEQSYLDAKKFP
jgi:hypothetical protein